MTNQKRRASQPRGNPREQETVRRMLLLAELAGCQLRPAANGQLRGLCPFHYATRTENVRALRVNEQRGTFLCSFCNIEGNAAMFAAHYWQVSVSEAAAMLQRGDDEITVERPTPVAMTPEEMRKPPIHRRQNTYLLTQAAAHYAQMLNRTPSAQNYLHRLGIPNRQWSRLNLGYARGTGLMEHLRQRAGVTDEELAASPLFRSDEDGRLSEVHQDVITVPNLDQAGNTTFIMTMFPYCPDYDRPWKMEMKRMAPISGSRPDLMGSFARREPANTLYVTDDLRVWLIIRAMSIPALYMTTIRERVAESVTQSIARMRSTSVIIAVTRPELAQQIAERVADDRPEVHSTVLDQESILSMFPPPRTRSNVFGNIHSRGRQRRNGSRSRPSRSETNQQPATSGAVETQPPEDPETAVLAANIPKPAEKPEPANITQPSPSPDTSVTDTTVPDDQETDDQEENDRTREQQAEAIRRLTEVRLNQPEDWAAIKHQLSPDIVELIEQQAAESASAT